MSESVKVKSQPVEYGVEIHLPKNLVLIKHHSSQYGWLVRAELRDDDGRVIAASPDVLAGVEPGKFRMAAINALCFVPTLPFGDLDYSADVVEGGEVVRRTMPVRSWEHVKDVMVEKQNAQDQLARADNNNTR